MNINELSGWIGEYDIIIKHKNGRIEREHLKNRITNAGLNMIRDALKGDLTDIEIKYLALGTSDLANDDTMTALGAEGFRTPWVSQSATQTGQLQSTALILDTEAVIHIKEIGIFAGSAATEVQNTGVLISRILWDRDKTNLESIQFVRTDTINRG